MSMNRRSNDSRVFRELEEQTNLLTTIASGSGGSGGVVDTTKDYDRDAYGQAITTDLVPVYQINSINNLIDDRETNTVIIGNGQVVSQDGLMCLEITTSVGDITGLESKRRLPYYSGTGCLTRFTTIFDSPANGISQFGGIGNDGNGLFFGYRNTTFGILRVSGGEGEVRSLKIDTAENALATATITLNNVVHNIFISSGSGAEEFTAYQIAEKLSLQLYEVEAIGDTVYFRSLLLQDELGTFSYSSTGASTGTFTKVKAGNPTIVDEFIPQSSWNCDTMDGTGDSGMILNPTLGNVYSIRYKWLGFGAIYFYIESDTTGRMIPVHRMTFANQSTSPSLRRPSMKTAFLLRSTGGTVAKTLKVGSFAGFNEGTPVEKLDSYFGKEASRLIPTTETNILTIGNKILFNDEVNSGELIIKSVSLAIDGAQTVIFRFYTNSVLGNDTIADYYINQNISTSSSIAYFDTRSRTLLGGVFLFSIVVAKDSSTRFDFPKIKLERDETITVTGESSGSSVQSSVAINWIQMI